MPKFQWIDKLKASGWDGSFGFMLDVLEPIAPVVSQFLWVMQPISGLFNGQDALKELAEALDNPEEFAALKEKLSTKN